MNADIINSSRRAGAGKARLMVVEDNPDHWALIEAASQQVMPDVDVTWVPNCAEALACLETYLTNGELLPRLMLLDLYLPDSEQSWQLLRTLKQTGSPYAWMPVVVISHSDRRDDINDFYAFGGTSYIVKPTTFEQWLAYFQTVRQYWWETVTLPGR